MLAFISPSVECASVTSAIAWSMKSLMPEADHESSRRPFSTRRSICFICALSRGFSTSNMVRTMWLYMCVTWLSLPIWTRKTSCFSKSVSAMAGALRPSMCRYLTSRSRRTKAGSKLTASSAVSRSRCSRGILSLSWLTSSTDTAQSSYMEASNSLSCESTSSWRATTSRVSSKSAQTCITLVRWLMGSSMRSMSPRTQKSEPATGGMLT
mmetsp:Transcript_4445/g.12940  ORF Transcript_4445/g.12940 Transcript_4445/m.12940 type:complete len:210 (-) Transcript_4445:1809-2438(-)